MALYAAFYKGTRPGVAGLYNRLVRKWERGNYSHVELVFSDGQCASASFEDKGVRFKKIDMDPERWDLVLLPKHLELGARLWFMQRSGKIKYDLFGQLRFLIMPITVGNDLRRVWCSEAVAAALDMPNPWRQGPNSLYDALVYFVQEADKLCYLQ